MNGTTSWTNISWIHSYSYLYILLEHRSHAKSNTINHLSIQVELAELWGFLCLRSAYSNVYLLLLFVMCMLLYAIGIGFLCWFQCNNPFFNCTRTDWDMIHINLYYPIRFSHNFYFLIFGMFIYNIGMGIPCLI